MSTHCSDVQLIVAVVQMPQVDSDLVVSLNTPQYISEKSAPAEHAGEQTAPFACTPLVIEPPCLLKTRSLRRRCTAGSGFKGHQLEAPELFKCMLQTLAIKDWGLFKPHN